MHRIRIRRQELLARFEPPQHPGGPAGAILVEGTQDRVRRTQRLREDVRRRERIVGRDHDRAGLRQQ